MKRRRPAELIWLALVLVACGAGAYRDADNTGYADDARQYNIHGVSPGMKQAEVERLLGQPREVLSAKPPVTWIYATPRIAYFCGNMVADVTFDSSGIVQSVAGNPISKGQRVIFWAGCSERELSKQLGPRTSPSYLSTGFSDCCWGDLQAVLYDGTAREFELSAPSHHPGS